MKKSLLLLVAAALTLGACMKKDPCPPCPEAPEPTEPPYVPTVYVAGAVGYEDVDAFAAVWVNGVIQHLGGMGTNPQALTANAFDVFVTEEDDIYVSGVFVEDYMIGDSPRAVIWKNGEIIEVLTEETSIGYQIFIENGDMYVALDIDEDRQRAALWKNGAIQYLGDVGYTTGVVSLFVYEGTSYVAGYAYDDIGAHTAKLWVNGMEQALGDSAEDATATSVFVYDGDVYVGLANQNTGIFTVLKNGAEEFTIDGVRGLYWRIFVEDGDVYVSGTTLGIGDFDVATLFKNGEPVFKSYDRSDASDVHVFDGIPYMSGISYTPEVFTSEAISWANGVPQTLHPAGASYSMGHSVFVK